MAGLRLYCATVLNLLLAAVAAMAADQSPAGTPEFGGLGIEVTQENGSIKVIRPLNDTPASRAGVKAGDLVVALDGKTLQGLSLSEAVDRMRCPPNSRITLTIRREGVDQPIQLSLQREVIHIQTRWLYD